MKLCFLFLIALFAHFGTTQADQQRLSKNQEAVIKGVEDNFLPDDHPIKLRLDSIFTSTRALSSTAAFHKAGFYNSKERRKGLIVTGHPDTPGYLFKLYLETSETDEKEQCLKRINGANLIRNALDNYSLHHIMKVPQKWVYAVPDYNIKQRGKFPKKYLLVVEDMNIFGDDENRKLYKKIITPEHLDALFIVLTTCLLSDSTWLPNIPFSHDGRIAFIDTEFAGNSQTIWSRLGRMNKNLSPEMRNYWTALVINSPRPKNIEEIASEGIVHLFEEASDVEEVDVPSYEFDVVGY